MKWKKAKVLEKNPFNIQLEGFRQMKKEYLEMMKQWQCKQDYELKWKNHTAEKKKTHCINEGNDAMDFPDVQSRHDQN